MPPNGEVHHALSLPTCRNLWRKTTACQARMGPRMAENSRSSTRPYDDVVVICREMRQSVVKALTSAVGHERSFDGTTKKVCSWG